MDAGRPHMGGLQDGDRGFDSRSRLQQIEWPQPMLRRSARRGLGEDRVAILLIVATGRRR